MFVTGQGSVGGIGGTLDGIGCVRVLGGGHRIYYKIIGGGWGTFCYSNRDRKERERNSFLIVSK